MIFSIKVKFYRFIMNALKLATKILPMPKPTLFTGKGSSLHLCEAIALVGVKKLLIVSDEVLVNLGILDEIKQALTENAVSFYLYQGVLPDPTFAQIEEGLDIYLQNDCDAVLAVGGGSPIDCAKVIAARVTNKKPIKKMAGKFKIWKPLVPFFAVPTTAGTGSEVTIAAVVSDTRTHQKSLIIDPKLVPVMAALDASLMTGLPPHVTSTTGMDALTHAIEAYLSQNASVDTDAYAIAAFKLIMQNLVTAVEEGNNIKARHNMTMASHYAGLAFTKAGVGYVHAISHNLGAKYGTPHGLANAIVLPYVLDFSKNTVQHRLARLAKVSGLACDNQTEIQLADILIAHIRSLLKRFDIPQHLEQLKDTDIPDLAKLALKEAHYNYAVPVYMNHTQCEQLLFKITK